MALTVDWTTGIWWHDGTAGGDGQPSARVTIASDWLPRGPHEGLIASDPLRVYGDLLPLLRNSDLNLVNVEGGIGQTGEPIWKDGPNLKMDDNAVRSLTEAPFHIGCLANNHILDFGPDNLRHTLHALQQAGLKTVGAGMTGAEAARPLTVDVNGISRIAIINCAEGEGCRSIDGGPGAHGLDKEQLVRQVRQLKQEADIVLVIFHGGREYVPLPPEYVTESLRAAARAGATAVVAHHPHVPQGIEVHEGVPIVYSQGNFVFWMEQDSFYRHAGFLVHLDLCGNRLERMSITPYLIAREGLSLMEGRAKEEFLQSLRLLSELLADGQKVREGWDALSDTIGSRGVVKIMERAIAEMEELPHRGAARVMNYLFTPAHRELYIHALRRSITGELGTAPGWAKTLLHHWQRCTMDEGLLMYNAPASTNGALHDLISS